MINIRKPLMAANWKMYKTAAEGVQFFQALVNGLKGLPLNELPDVVVCPPYTALSAAAQFLAEQHVCLNLGAQNMEAHEDGAYTGEISARMLLEFQTRYVILGHSERRQYFAETDERVNAKMGTALQHGLTPIVCVGESLEQREAGQTDAWIQQQVTAALKGFNDTQRGQMVFAYEPIWAIGTGKVCDANEANRVCGLIRQTLGVPQVRVLYGGSVKPDNVVGLMAQPEIDGGLVGGASLEAASFLKLVQAAMPVKV